MSTTKWPTGFRMKSRPWVIEYVDRLKDDFSENPENPANDLLGETRVDLRLIRISRDQCEESMRDTVIHELGHAFFATLPGADRETEGAEEAWVEAVTELFFEIVQNAESAFWLPGEEDDS